MKTNNNKIKKTTKTNIKIQAILLIILIIIIIVLTVIKILNTEKTEKTEYGGIIFNKEMDLDIINLIESSDETPIQVPVPKGYTASSVASERTVKGGFVIYEGKEPVTEANLEQAKRTRNQFVWIPIENASDMYHMVNNKMYGAYYEFTATGYTRKTATNEPQILKDIDKQGTNLEVYLDGISQSEFLKEIEESFYEMIESVATYGGFYIGRYETGNLSKNEPVVVKMNTDIHSVKWYNMYKRSKRVSGLNENVETNMIWGIQFDETLKWLIDTENKTYEEIAKDSTSWGNYFNATFKYTNTSGGTSTKSYNADTRIPTGSTEYTKANNIYDLAGNMWEWTMENYAFQGGKNCRGGSKARNGQVNPVYFRNYNYLDVASNCTLRFTSNTLYKIALNTTGSTKKLYKCYIYVYIIDIKHEQ